MFQVAAAAAMCARRQASVNAGGRAGGVPAAASFRPPCLPRVHSPSRPFDNTPSLPLALPPSLLSYFLLPLPIVFISLSRAELI